MLRRLFQRKARQPIPLLLYGRSECPLCDEMKEALERTPVGEPWELSEIDIDGDPALEDAYGRSIPVLFIGGRLAFKGRLGAAEFQKKFARLARAWREGGEPCP